MRQFLIGSLFLNLIALPVTYAEEVRLPELPVPQQAQLSEARESEGVQRVYPQASISRISGRLRIDQSIETRGRLTALTWELPDERHLGEAFAQARLALLEQGAQLLYWCEGRDCGSSSLWANSIFGNARLYGPDNQQGYMLLRLDEPRADSLLALYMITRGNRRAYLHAERLDADASLGRVLPSAATLLRQLREHGSLALRDLSGEPDPEWVSVLVRALNLDSTLRVSLAGPQAAAWRDALVARNVRAGRLELAANGGDGLRIELLR